MFESGYIHCTIGLEHGTTCMSDSVADSAYISADVTKLEDSATSGTETQNCYSGGDHVHQRIQHMKGELDSLHGVSIGYITRYSGLLRFMYTHEASGPQAV